MSKQKIGINKKITICKRYQKGEPCSKLAKEYGVNENTIWFWVRMYQANGAKIFEKDSKKGNKKYSKEFKLKIVEEYILGQRSIKEICCKYEILAHSVVERWIKKYNDGIELKDYNPERGIYTMKSRTTTYEERLEIVKYVLAHENDYKGAAKQFDVSYANVYSWTKKYKEKGELGLQDNRGRTHDNEDFRELTELEKKDIEIEKLKKKLEYAELVNVVLKKNIEIREQMERDSRLLDKKTNIKRFKK